MCSEDKSIADLRGGLENSNDNMWVSSNADGVSANMQMDASYGGMEISPEQIYKNRSIDSNYGKTVIYGPGDNDNHELVELSKGHEISHPIEEFPVVIGKAKKY